MTYEILLQNEVFITLFSETLLLILNIIAFIGSVKILKNWDFHATTPAQYKLEKLSYLIVLIITVSLLFNILLLPYFAYTIESLSAIVPGAMCGAGVIGANDFGNPLLLLKILILFFVGIWLIINHEDLKAKNYPYTRKKFWFFTVIFIMIVSSYTLEIAYFTNISLEKPVSCCSVIFGLSGENSLPFGLNIEMILAIFYLLALLNILFIWQKQSYALALSSLGFLFVAYYAVTHFFGTYIYQLPTHICPFCMLQGEYFYIGYLLWGLLFITVFLGIANAVLKVIIGKELVKFYRYALFALLAFIMITGGYVMVYVLRNGVWL
ncbi:MAG TPA: hypothetical protein EYG95_03020 [Campylobacterales bacterium]|nr:hypothetical protein [Campylobacterales bacterium]